MSSELSNAELARRYGDPLRSSSNLSELDRMDVRSPRISPAKELKQNVGVSAHAGIQMTRKPDLGVRPRQASPMSREDFELACIREFSHSGHHLGVGVSRAERRERIRGAILRENKGRRRWQDSGSTYAEVYAQAYQQKLAVGEGADKIALAAWGSEADEDLSDDEILENEDSSIASM
jgi:hypothetical protein